MKIAHKISLSFLTIAVILTICSVAVIYYIVKGTILDAIYMQLETTTQAKVQHIETYLEMLKVSSGQFSKSVVLENYLKALKETPEKSQQAFTVAMRRLKNTKEANPEVFEFLLADATGKIVASSNKESIGGDKSDDAFFVGAQKNT